ncbi:MAG: hypothetical protein EBY17_31600, partial [Acidobacteriia bacterium]|nr:hypothetical protein [Terriglobia bacterium]
MTNLTSEIIETLRPALRSITQAERLLNRFWADRIALMWTTGDLHRAANENKTVLTDEQARQLLHNLNDNYNAQYGLRWSDLTETIQQSGLGRDIKRSELHRFIHRDVLVIDPPQRTIRSRLAGTNPKPLRSTRKT